MNITSGVIAKAQRVVAYGPEGIGKSTFASRFPDPLFIDTEGSTDEMDVPRMDRPSSWEFLNQQIDWVINNQPCKTLIIDTIDWAEMLATNFVVNRGGKKSITGFGYGEGFIQLEEEIGKFLNKLTDLYELGINVVLTAHAKVVRFEQPDEIGAYDRWELKLGNKTTAKTASLVKEWATMVLFMNYKVFSVATDDQGKRHKGQGGERVIHSTHHPAWDAKNRHNLPDEFPLDYAHIAHIFDNQSSGQQQPVSNTNTQPTTQEQPAPQPEESVQQTETKEQPKNDPVPESQPNAEQSQPEQSELDPAIPQSLRDLMTQHNVSEEDIQVVVSDKGYYPMDTPIVNYDPSFIEGVLVGAWEQVHGMIKDFNEKVPFN